MKTGEERQRKEKGGKSQGGMDIIFKLSIKDQGPNKRHSKPYVKGWVCH